MSASIRLQPCDLCPAEGGDVDARGTVNGDPGSARDESDDFVAWDWCAAASKV